MRKPDPKARAAGGVLAAVVLLLLMAWSLPVAGRDDRILWSEEGIDSGGGGWWFHGHITERISSYEAAGVPPQVLHEAVRNVPRIKQATITQEGQKHYWYWYGFRFSKSKAKGVYIHGPGSVRVTLTDPEDPRNSFTVLDEGMLVSCDEEMDCYRDTALGGVTVKPYSDDSRRQICVWCLIRLPQEVEGRTLDRITVLSKVEPIDGGWEVIR